MAEPVKTIIPTFPDLAGKVAVVTGGSKGIGAATCKALAANGARVAVVARDQAGIDRLVKSLASHGATAIGVSMEGADYDSVQRCREKVEAELGPTDILMIFAGGFGRLTRVTEITEKEWREVLDSNLTSTFFACKSFLPGMIERGHGSIVTMSSNAARNLDV